MLSVKVDSDKGEDWVEECVSAEKLGKLSESRGRIDSRESKGEDGDDVVEKLETSATKLELSGMFILKKYKIIFCLKIQN